MRSQIRAPLIVLLVLVSTPALGDQIITTVAGGGSLDGPALSTPMSPFYVALDTGGNFFVAGGSFVFRVDASGNLTVVAGTGILAFGGDGGQATSANIDSLGVAVDGSGNLFMADFRNQRIRRVDAATGIITTVAGNGTAGFSGDEGPATSASLNHPTGLALDGAGNIFILDQLNQRIRRVAAATGVITTVAGNGTAGFSGDEGPATDASFSFHVSPIGALFTLGIAVDGFGNIFVADYFNQRIRRIASGIITTVAGNGTAGFGGDNGPATNANLDHPCGVAADGAGNLFIADCNNRRVRRVDPGGTITTFAGNGTSGFGGDGDLATNASLGSFFNVAVDQAGNLYIGDFENGRVRRVDAANGIINSVAGGRFGPLDPRLGEGRPATQAAIRPFFGVGVDPAGNLLIADSVNERVRRVDRETGILTTVVGTGTTGFGGDGGSATAASLAGPTDLAFDGGGNLFFSDRGNERVRRVAASTGVITSVAGNGTAGFGGDEGPASSASLNQPRGLALDDAGNLFIADLGNDRVRRVDPAGVITTFAGNGVRAFGGDGGSATSASLNLPFYLAVDAANNLFITDANNHRIRRVDAAGIITTFAGNNMPAFGGDGGLATSASLNRPRGLAFDSVGNLLMSDANNRRIRRVDPGGIITTIAGTGVAGFAGDGGPAINANLGLPTALALDSADSIFVVDALQRVRRIFESETATPSGTNVAVEPVDTTLGTSPVDVTFDTVAQAGTTSLTTSDTGPTPASGFQLGDPPTYFDLSTTAVLSGPITVCISYTGISFTDETSLRLFHFENDVWVDRTTSLDTVNDIICGSVTSLSPVGVFERENQAPVANAGPDGSVECTSAAGSSVSLDGSGSSDAEGNPLTYTWTGFFLEGTGLVSGVNPTVTLPLGTSTVTLVVSDGGNDSQPDTVAITVGVRAEGLQAPLASLVPEGQPVPLPNVAFKQGSTLPLKVQLFCGGTALTDSLVLPPRIVALRRTGLAIDLTTVELDAGQANDSGLFFRSSGGGTWVYNLSTKDLGSGTYEIVIRMPDGRRLAGGFVLRH